MTSNILKTKLFELCPLVLNVSARITKQFKFPASLCQVKRVMIIFLVREPNIKTKTEKEYIIVCVNKLKNIFLEIIP